MQINGLAILAGSIKELVIPTKSSVGTPNENALVLDDTSGGPRGLAVRSSVAPQAPVSSITAFSGPDATHLWEKENSGYGDPENYDTYSRLFSAVNQNFYYSLADKNSGETRFTLTGDQSIDVSFEARQDDYASNYASFVEMEGLFRLNMPRAGGYGNPRTDVELLTYGDVNTTRTDLLPNYLHNNWVTYRVVMDSEGLKMYINGTLRKTLAAYTFANVSDFRFRAYVGSNMMYVRNVSVNIT